MYIHLLSILGFAGATLLTQATSHFVVNAGHYAQVAHLRPGPIFPLGLLAMVVQGAILSFLYARAGGAGRPLRDAMTFAWLAGGFLVSYIALAEAANYTVPDVGPWIAVELGAGFVQFTLFGLLLGLAHRMPARRPSARPARV